MGVFEKKKSVWMLLSVGLVAGLLAGCAGGGGGGNAENGGDASNAAGSNSEASDAPAGTDEKVTIKFSGWGEPNEKKLYEDLIKNFESQNPNIKVQYIHIPADYAGKMNTVLAGGNAPDVFYAGDGDVARWIKLGVIKNIQQQVDESGFDMSDMYESAVDRYRYDGMKMGTGDLYALPMDVAGTVLYYNKKLFDEAGVPYPSAETPMTFDELVEVGKKLTKDSNGDGKPDQYGMGPAWWEGFVWGNGGKILSDDRTQFVLNEDKAVEALQFAADMRNVHKISPDARALQAMNDGQMFETGKLAMMIGGRWSVPVFRNLKFDWDVAPIPANGAWSGWSASTGYSVYAKTKYPDQAFKFAAYLAGEEANRIRSEQGLTMPVYKSMANSDVFLTPGTKPENAQVFLKAVETEQAGPWTYVPNNKWWDIINQNLGQMWEGKTTAKDLMEKIKPDVEKALREGNPELFQ
ncbi:ABC transporter substrate-binding protein [Paenibacillus arenilitoris]|uniref:Sugar ABC transporter substrate-binding protein n=1 Tax=Paenibacillus arenilitoris TaxID=2772299 RepID=A0A927CH25_9BACL|nr:sugar ABC transporter substrate-binding protein [Paenibacillus arenilitoris]MBD2867405.1 sugar ABC transporter substrate-binding protein [Paenibacillus arenilitoris]